MSNRTKSCESCGKEITDSTLFEVPLRSETRSLIRKRRLYISDRDGTRAMSGESTKPTNSRPPETRHKLEPLAKKLSNSAEGTESKVVKTEQRLVKPSDEAGRVQAAQGGAFGGGGGGSYRMLCSRFLLECARGGIAEEQRSEAADMGTDRVDEDADAAENGSDGDGTEKTRWHECCLKCDCCDALIGELGSSVYERHGLLFCKRDYLRLFVMPVTCSRCGVEVMGHEQVMRAGGSRVFHLDCFACHRCASSFCVGDRFYTIGPHIYCESDYLQLIAESGGTA